MTRISFKEMESTIAQAFVRAGMPPARAAACATVHASSSCDGVYSHGLNRVERFVEYIGKQWVDVHASPTLHLALGAMEIYNGQLGPGILNAQFAMERAMQLATANGFGLVSLCNTTHWMRGGSYGWQAAEKGFISICWTNTESCMPAWGSSSCCIGNNPFIMAVPRKEGHIVLDMAMSQYSYGKLEVTRLQNQRLPYPGGFNQEGKLTDDPAAIEATRRVLPIGFWKGSGFAILLDLLASLLSGGLCTAAIDKSGKGSSGSCSQVFIAINPLAINTQEFVDKVLNETIAQLQSAVPVEENGQIRYPGESSLATRQENLRLGIPVDEAVWQKVKALAGR